jgi:hypothetical protein
MEIKKPINIPLKTKSSFCQFKECFSLLSNIITEEICKKIPATIPNNLGYISGSKKEPKKAPTGADTANKIRMEKAYILLMCKENKNVDKTIVSDTLWMLNAHKMFEE